MPAPLNDPIAARIAQRFGEYRRQEYEPLGIITEMQTPAGVADKEKVISFGTGRGPALGIFADGGIDLLDAWEWNGLPDRYQSLDTLDKDGNFHPENLCPECRAPCNECYPGGFLPADMSPVEADINRGIIRVALSNANPKCLLEPGERLCVYGSQLSACGGAGVIVAQDNAPCPSCGGTGKVKCRKCAGSARMSTGRTPDGRLCAACRGNGKVQKVIRQDFIQHLVPQSFDNTFTPGRAVLRTENSYACLRETLYLGPIFGMMVTGADKHTKILTGKPDLEGNYPHIVSQKQFTRGSRAVILGGVLRIK